MLTPSVTTQVVAPPRLVGAVNSQSATNTASASAPAISLAARRGRIGGRGAGGAPGGPPRLSRVSAPGPYSIVTVPLLTAATESLRPAPSATGAANVHLTSYGAPAPDAPQSD